MKSFVLGRFSAHYLKHMARQINVEIQTFMFVISRINDIYMAHYDYLHAHPDMWSSRLVFNWFS